MTKEEMMSEQLFKYSSRIAKQLTNASEENEKQGHAELAGICSAAATSIQNLLKNSDALETREFAAKINRIIKSFSLDNFSDEGEREIYQKNVRQIVLATRGV